MGTLDSHTSFQMLVGRYSLRYVVIQDIVDIVDHLDNTTPMAMAGLLSRMSFASSIQDKTKRAYSIACPGY